MRIILIDDYGARERRVLGPGDVIRVEDVFAPCCECGNAVLLGDVDGEMVCRHCRAREAKEDTADSETKGFE